MRFLSQDIHTKRQFGIAYEDSCKDIPFHCCIFQHSLNRNCVLFKQQGLRNHICDICGKDFLHFTSFECHMKYHNNERNIACPHCPMKFVMSSHLYRHLQTHVNFSECFRLRNLFLFLKWKINQPSAFTYDLVF